MNWLYYLLEANLYLVLFYGFYRLFLQNETFYNLNRYFLLLSTVISFALPVLQFGFLKPSNYQIQGDIIYELPPPPMEPSSVSNLNNSFADLNWFYIFYLVIAFGFALKLSFSIYKIIKIWLKAKKHTAGDITLVEVNGESTAFSFFNLLFIHPALANQPAVLKHEMAHIRQKHSFDVVFFELVQIICWFNPILHFIKKDIKLLHEYIADELTTNADVQKHEYALFLIQNSFGLRAQPITNQIFNQSILKRRINMLNKKRTAGWARLRLLLALPLTGSMLCMSTMAFTKDYGYVDLLPEKSEFVAPIQDKPEVENSKKKDYGRPPLPLKYFLPSLITGKNKEVYSVEKRYILINGKWINDLSTFYGAANADKIIYLNSANAVKKYGNAAKSGAVEITGKNIHLLSVSEGPIPPKADQIKFPPPIVRQDKDRFTPRIEVRASTQQAVNTESRYIVINGKPLKNSPTFYGVTNTKDVIYLNSRTAVKKYGDVAKFGAVEIIGDDIKYVTDPPHIVPPPPLPAKRDQIKFPPPVVKFEQKYFTPNFKKDRATGNLIVSDRRYFVVNGNPIEDNSKFFGVTHTETVTFLNATDAMKVYGAEKGKYGAVEVQGANIYFNKQNDQIKFPPPIVKQDKPRKVLKAPPPPVEPSAPKKSIGAKTPQPPVPKVKTVPGDPVSLMKEQLKLEKKSMGNTPTPPVEVSLATLNKTKKFLEERFEETKNDETKGFIQQQITLIESQIAKKSSRN